MISVVIPVFRNATGALELVHSLLQQQLPPAHSLEIIVVDDGSDDGSPDLLRQCEGEHVRLIVLPHNMGRSTARNTGAELARGEFLVFIDCDCRPSDAYFLASHLQQLHSGCLATYGPVTGDGRGFWSRYQSDASARRARQHSQGSIFAGSSQNFAVQASAFRQTGGFDIRYATYGFEDRDLFVRLSRAGTMGWCANAIVKHLDQITLSTVLEKMYLSAGESAALFSHDHREAYKRLGYAALDSRIHGCLRLVDALLSPLLRLAPIVNRLLVSQKLPYTIAKPIVKVFVALSYVHGTTGSLRRVKAI